MSNLVLYANNGREFYDLYSWLRDKVGERITKGLQVDANHLAECSTMKKIIGRVAAYGRKYGERYSTDERRAARLTLAEQIIEECYE